MAGLAGLVIACCAAGAAGAAGVDPQLRALYTRILRNPTDPDLNIRYARRAEEIGELRKALAAYERVLLNDPHNSAALRGLVRIKGRLEPPFLKVKTIFGLRMESNPRYASHRFGTPESDIVASMRVVARDERKLGRMRWRTNAQALGTVHGVSRILDFHYAGVDVGPLIPVGIWRIRPALSAAYSALDYKTFFKEVGAQLNLEAPHGGAFQRVDFRFAYDFIGGAYDEGRNGFIVEAAPRFVFPNVAFGGDGAILRPSVLYNGAGGREPDPTVVRGDLFPQRYVQVGLKSAYNFPIAGGDAYAGVFFDVNYRIFDNDIPGEDKTRRDLYIDPGVQIVIPGFLSERHDLVLRYDFERNVSNDGLRNFVNHRVGVQSVWRVF
jgi:hypothetical protein